MFSIRSLSFNAMLRQPWNSFSCTQGDDLSAYIEFPSGAINNFLMLEADPLYPSIKEQFLGDIEQLKLLACEYVGTKYDDSIAVFSKKIDNPDETIRDVLLPVYRETRHHIHCLVQKLTQYKLKTAESDAQALTSKNQISFLLEECLTGIEFCLPGVHARFSYSMLTLEAAENGLSGEIFQHKCNLFNRYIHWFLLCLQRESSLKLLPGMEIHYFNGLYNIYCESLFLPLISDRLATTNWSGELIRSFLHYAPLYINATTIFREILNKWSEKLSQVIEEQGVMNWLIEPIDSKEMTGDRLEALNCQFFNPLNLLVEPRKGKNLDLWWLIEDTQEGNYFCFTRYREKLAAWLAQTLSNEAPTIFSPTFYCQENKQYIGRMNNLFFWVFDADQRFEQEENCTFSLENYISLQLQHLTSIQFSSWPAITCAPLLTQALFQTSDAKEVAAFFLNSFISEELSKLEQTINNAIYQVLNNKIIENGKFKNDLFERICKHFSELTNQEEPILLNSLKWIINTPLVEAVLCKLKQQGREIRIITASLNTWQICDFSEDKMEKLFSVDDFQRLFKQALKLQQYEITSNLICTGYCDHLLNIINEERDTLLHLLSRAGAIKGLNYLLENIDSVQINETNDEGCTALYLAARHGRLECVKALLCVENVQVNKRKNSGFSPIHSAIINNQLECLKALLCDESILVNEMNINGFTPLSLAVLKENVEYVKALLAFKNIEVNTLDIYQNTALHIAIDKGTLECIKTLLDVENIKVNVIGFDGYPELHRAILRGDLECVEMLLDIENIEINATDLHGNTALHRAIIKGNLECVQMLLGVKNIEINAIDLDGNTPLHRAIIKGNLECVKMLLGVKNIEINATDLKGNTPLHRAIIKENLKCVEILLKAKNIKINEVNNLYLTPLQSAILKGSLGCIKILVKDTSIQINKQTNAGRTALHFAVESGEIECLAALLENVNVDVNKEDANKDTALITAIKKRDEACIYHLLSNKNIDINKISSSFDTPLTKARRKGLTDIVRQMERDPRLNKSIDRMLRLFRR